MDRPRKDWRKKFPRIIATDASREQITSAAHHPAIDYRVATAENSRLPDESVGLLTVAQALHWFDFRKILRGS